MNNDRINDIRARCEAATPGPWLQAKNNVYVGKESTRTATAYRRADANFISEAREDLPWALDQIATLQAELNRLTEAQRWIPVTERLPERPRDNGCGEIARSWYLVALKSGCVMTARFDFDEFLGRTGWQETGTAITHWMPLPAAPEEGE